MKIPSNFVSGDDVTWFEESFYDSQNNLITPDTYQLSFAIRGPSQLTVNSSIENGKFKFNLTNVQTLAISEGEYFWQAYAVNGSTRTTVATGRLTVLKNYSTISTSFDGRSQDEIDLDNVDSAIRSLVSGGAIKQYKIMNREVQKMSIGELKDIRTMLVFRIARKKRAEMIRTGQGDPLSKLVSF